MADNVWLEIPTGTIVDSDIRRLTKAGKLITEGYSPAHVKQACYELRASEIVYETSEPRENKRFEVGQEGYVLRPQSSATLIVQEKIELPANVMARILTKGQLFSVGILPVCTYADPGFVGRLGITLSNASHRAVVIRRGQPIAKIEFSVLSAAVDNPYSGQHGYDTEIWPIPTHLYATEEDLKRAKIDLASPEEIARSYGPVVIDLVRRLKYYEYKVWLQISITVAAFAVLFALAGEFGLLVSVLTGVAANLLTNLGFYLHSRHSIRRG